MARTNKHKNKLPEVLPAAVRCVPLFVPDDPEWYAALLGAVKELTYLWRYDKGDQAKALDTRDLWKEVTYHPLMENLRDGVTCETGTPTDPQDCTIINPIHPSIGYFPNHPTLTPDAGGAWPAPAWCTDCNLPGLGLATDVLIRVDSGPFFINLADMLASGVPSFTLYFSGEGEIDVRFAAVPVGGLAWVFPDGNPLLGQAIDLEWHDLDDFAGTALIEIFIGLLVGDLVSSTTRTHEFVFDTPGSHTLTAWFFPKVELEEWPPVGWGGGLRGIQLCGDSIVLEDAPLPYTLQCSDSELELLLDGSPVSTIDLDVCHPHPANPDWTLNRNNGDLQLLKDAVLHDSVPFPNYNTSYTKATHLLELLRDTIVVDTTPLPSYVLLKPEIDEIHLVRDGTETDSIIEDKFFTYRLQENGDQHELTEDASVVSSVTDDVTPGAEMITYYEAEWDLTLTRIGGNKPAAFAIIGGLGLWVHEQGFVSSFDVPSSEMELDVAAAVGDFIELSRIRLTYLVAAGATGTFQHFAVQPGGVLYHFPDSGGTASGPETKVFDMPIDFRWNTNQTLRFQYEEIGAESDELVTLQKIEFMGIGWPQFKTYADITSIAMFNELSEAFA